MPNPIQQEAFSPLINSGRTMFEDLYGLYVKPRVIGTLTGQDHDLKENMMISIGEYMLSHRRLLWMPQATTAAVFTNMGADMSSVVTMYTLLYEQGALYMPPDKNRSLASFIGLTGTVVSCWSGCRWSSCFADSAACQCV